MRFFKIKNILLLFFIALLGCVEPIPIETISYENYLVVEASITSEFKRHNVVLSRTFEIDTNENSPETGASVSIIDSQNNRYLFTETTPGNYISNTEFNAESNNSYTLKITTRNGNSYTSKPQQLTTNSQIEKLTTLVETSTEGEQGVSISVHSFNPNNNSNYYRYTFEETYKISPPYWSDSELVIVSDTRPYQVELQRRTVNNKDCYKTIYSTDILLTETKSLAEDRVNFPLRFILSDDFIISKRYSILVKQFVQTPEAYNYYKTLKKVSGTENVFAQVQPGFINGNITSDSDRNEKVIGFFEVSSVSEKRLFFNFEDIFPNQTSYFPNSCDFVAPLLSDPFTGESPLIDLIKDNTHTYFKENDTGAQHLEGKYLLVPKICGDCTVLGSNIKPSFWID